ncbi:MAG TPA: hypothetical protein VHW24_11830 [Bryobacteraceae bacterium]|jgi:hypothetical protein|nr:hypothetical protein [Bryobacteraceae bacterium]
MKKFAVIAAVPLFAGLVMAQSQQTAATTTTTSAQTSNFDGALVDQGCYTTHVQQKNSNTDVKGATSQTVSDRYTTECPVTAETSSFGMVTPEGKFVRFDDAGNTQIVQMVKSNKDWNDSITNKKPVKVHVIGTENGGVIVIKEIR